MITNNQLKKNLAKDGFNLSEDECNTIRGFLVKLATIEYDIYNSNKNQSSDCRVVEIPVISPVIDFHQDLKNVA